MRFCGLVFDIGDTLFDATVWRRWLAARLRLLGAPITPDQLVQRWEALLVDVYRGRADYWRRFGELLASMGIRGQRARELTRQARARGHEVQTCRVLFDGVRQTLVELRDAGARLAALSDTESTAADVRRSLADLGIVGCFHAVVSSADIGCVKPQRRAYEAAADALGLPVAACAFVGHDADELAGAMSAGMFAIAYNHDPRARADLYLDDFRQLKDLARLPVGAIPAERPAGG